MCYLCCFEGVRHTTLAGQCNARIKTSFLGPQESSPGEGSNSLRSSWGTGRPFLLKSCSREMKNSRLGYPSLRTGPVGAVWQRIALYSLWTWG